MAISADLGKTLESYVSKLVAKGRYNSKSEVLREGVRLLQDREAKLAALEAMLESGVDDVKSGRVTPLEDAFDKLHAKYAVLAKGKVA